MTSPVLGPNRPARRKILWDVEVRILAFGLFLTLLTVVALGIGWLVNPELAARFAAMTRLNLTVGRAAGRQLAASPSRRAAPPCRIPQCRTPRLRGCGAGAGFAQPTPLPDIPRVMPGTLFKSWRWKWWPVTDRFAQRIRTAQLAEGRGSAHADRSAR